MLQVFQQINRPDLRPGYLNDLTIRDDTPLGSNEAWVRYLQTGEASPALLHMKVPAIMSGLCWSAQSWDQDHAPHGTTWLSQAAPI